MNESFEVEIHNTLKNIKGDLIMTYIVESICPEENLVTIYYRHNIDDANKWAQFLKDEYSVETEVYTEYDYMKLHPEKFYEQDFADSI